MSVEKCGWTIQKNLFAYTNLDSVVSYTCENSKMFNITPRYSSFFNNKTPVSWVTHITKDFLTCYSFSYYSSMLLHKQLYKSCKRLECLGNNKLNNIKIKRTDMGFDNLKKNWVFTYWTI